ncbi:MAG: hypothetical protein M3Y09_16270 [Actinomycetota bacterium]|nr:hypothetical protein [Actinomycetota bacterium]
MHVLDRSHLPRLISVSIAAAVLAIVISLAFAASISNITQPANNTSVSARPSAPVLASSAVHTITPRWAADPFASLISQPAPLPWLTARP